jgi:hypothetical protein
MSKWREEVMRPKTSYTERLYDLSAPEEKETKVDMFKVLDNFKKSVNYFNSFGLDDSSKTSRKNKK